jgi:hypothetical protein
MYLTNFGKGGPKRLLAGDPRLLGYRPFLRGPAILEPLDEGSEGSGDTDSGDTILNAN